MKKATHAQFNKLITRATPLPLSPELKLVIAILTQAWIDADKVTDRESIQFFVDGRSDFYAELIGIDPEFLTEVFIKHHPKSYETVPYVS